MIVAYIRISSAVLAFYTDRLCRVEVLYMYRYKHCSAYAMGSAKGLKGSANEFSRFEGD